MLIVSAPKARLPWALAAMAGLMMTSPAHAQYRPGTQEQSDPEMVGDVATTPLEDLNLKGDKIPPVLQSALADPYGMGGIRKCASIIGAVGELDAVLGPDFDVPVDADVDDKRRGTVGRIGKRLVGGLIPFRGLVREISGAAERDRKMQEAIYAGVTRRAFLKGMGQQRGCKAPGRPAPMGAPGWTE